MVRERRRGQGAVLASHFFSGVSRSTDGGVTWEIANTGLPVSRDGLPAFIAEFAAVGNDVFAAVQWFGGDDWGVFRSSDGGLSWSPARNGLPLISVKALAWHDGRLYAGTKPWFVTRLPFADPFEGVYVSDDHGQTWSQMPGLNGIAVQDLEVHNGVVYAGTIGAGVWALRAACSAADLSGDSDSGEPGYGVPDGVLDASDLFYFLDQFAVGNLGQADLTGSSDPLDPSYGQPDGNLDASDFFYFLDVFAAGCP